MTGIGWILAFSSVALVACSSLAADAEAYRSVPGSRPTADSPALGRQIVVTFVDKRNGQVTIGDAAQSYRRRGHYGNSTWSEQLASRVAEQYRLKQLGQWPITALGLHCVAYEITAGQSVETVLRALTGDERVETAQAMHSFSAMSRAGGHSQWPKGGRPVEPDTIHPLAFHRPQR